jgi:hypothetical protein
LNLLDWCKNNAITLDNVVSSRLGATSTR